MFHVGHLAANRVEVLLCSADVLAVLKERRAFADEGEPNKQREGERMTVSE